MEQHAYADVKIKQDVASEELCVSCIDTNTFKVFLAQHPTHAGLNDPNWQQTLAEAMGTKLILYGMFGGSRLEGVGSAAVRRKGLATSPQRPQRYMGYVGETPKVLRHLLAHKGSLRKIGVGMTYYNLPPTQQIEIAEFEQAGFKVMREEVRVLPLHGVGDINDLLAEASSSVRTTYRKAAKAGLRMRDATKWEVTDVFPYLLAQAYEEHGAQSPYKYNIGESVWDNHGPNSLHCHDFYLRTAYQDDQIAGMMITYHNKDAKHSYSLFMDRNKHNSSTLGNVSAFMVFDAALEGVRRGQQTLDLGGGPDTILDFKRRVGGKEEHSTTLHYTDPIFHKLYTLRSKIKGIFR